ncbi:hypothetical protein ACIP98_36290 [Streptomyces sp. NPDC088354]|uniref:hypothetical protein n=1 Tax=Streptomyces sp. NPDC088354 TaxID=3365856 RepID=UPI0038144F56
MAGFEFDQNAVDAALNEGMQRFASELTSALGSLSEQYQGRPLEEIKPEIQRVWGERTGGGTVTEPELTQFAEQIQAGGTVTIRLS